MKPNLLLVEDDSSTQAALIRLFRHLFHIQTSNSGKEALDKIQNGFEPDIIFSDFIMPEMSGIEFLSKAKEILPSAIRLVLTGHIHSDELTQAMKEETIHRVFLKPWENDILLFQMQEVINQQKILKENVSLEKLATTDSITGLFNQRYFQDNLQKELDRAHRYERNLCLILVDVDGFKKINDSIGHPAGDDMLKKVSDILKNGVRKIDTVCRIGGDEFAIILPDTTIQGAKEVAERIRKTCQQTAATTLSMGVALLPKNISQTGPFVELTDKALYKAKNNGRNQTVVAE